MTPPIVCVIPVRNGANTLQRAIMSAYAAGCDRVMVCDDASTDNTKAVIQNIYNIREDGHLTFIWFSEPVRAGCTVARNHMIASPLADGHLIVPLDADDTLRDVRVLAEAWEENTWVYGDYWQHEGEEHTRIPGAPAGVLPRRECTGITFLFHKDDWKKVGGYDSDFAYCEDYSMQCNLVHNGVQPKYVKTIVYDRYLKANGNERTSLAGLYWSFYRDMCRMKYPSLFTVNR